MKSAYHFDYHKPWLPEILHKYDLFGFDLFFKGQKAVGFRDLVPEFTTPPKQKHSKRTAKVPGFQWKASIFDWKNSLSKSNLGGS